MARPTQVFTIKAVAEIIDEDVELIELITSNSDNIDYGEIIYIHDGADQSARGFTDRGVECIQELLANARGWDGGLHEFLVADHCDPEAIERIMEKERDRIEAKSDGKS